MSTPLDQDAPGKTVVITGASRGLGLASSVRLYREGWHVIAAMRSVDAGMERLRAETGAAAGDPRLSGVQLDLSDPESVQEAAKTVLETVGPPDVLVHNAGISAAGHSEETTADVWERMFATHVMGPVTLTNALLPSMREAGRGRIVCVSSVAGQRGMPATSPYSATKAALERWAESLANEVAPFGLGVTVLVTGTFDTDIITDAGAIDHRSLEGPYAVNNQAIDRRGRMAIKMAAPADDFAKKLAKAIESDVPFTKRPVGFDARMLLLISRALPPIGMHHLIRLFLGLPRHGSLARQAEKPS